MFSMEYVVRETGISKGFLIYMDEKGILSPKFKSSESNLMGYSTHQFELIRASVRK